MKNRAKTALILVIFLLMQLLPWALVASPIFIIGAFDFDLNSIGTFLNDLAASQYPYTFELNSDGTYTVTVRESYAFREFGGGTLFSLMMMPTGDDTYKDFPSYELLCALDTPEGSFYVIALFPTDVQFAEGHAEAYMDMFNNVNQVLQTIEAKDGIEMAMP